MTTKTAPARRRPTLMPTPEHIAIIRRLNAEQAERNRPARAICERAVLRLQAEGYQLDAAAAMVDDLMPLDRKGRESCLNVIRRYGKPTQPDRERLRRDNDIAIRFAAGDVQCYEEAIARLKRGELLPGAEGPMERYQAADPQTAPTGSTGLSREQTEQAQAFAGADPAKFEWACSWLRSGKKTLPGPDSKPEDFLKVLLNGFPGATLGDAEDMLAEVKELNPPARFEELRLGVVPAFNHGLDLGDVIKEHRAPGTVVFPGQRKLKRGHEAKQLKQLASAGD